MTGRKLHVTPRDELIAVLLGDQPPSARLRRWLRTPEGRRERAAHRQALAALHRLYGEARVAPVRRAVYYSTLATPIGRVLVAVGDAGLVRVSFREREASFVARLRAQLRADVVRSPARTARIVHQLRAYFAGQRRRFDVQVDLSRLTPFHRHVLMATAAVPPGRVVSYGEIARRIGRPHGSRAVGQALGRNPVPIVIPCHRIVAAGGLGGYGGGLAIKRKLLRLEGALGATA
jgi:methylated-DNA-[protein]-cysteine S-methyltransferase